MSNLWNHSICAECFDWIRPGQTPIAIKPEFVEQETCCLCGHQHKSGIYIRRDPAVMPCRFYVGSHLGLPISCHDPVVKEI